MSRAAPISPAPPCSWRDGPVQMVWHGNHRCALCVVMEMLGRESMANLDPTQVAPPVLHAVGSVALALAPLFGGMAAIVILANVLQVGFQIHPERLAFNFGALNPLRGLSKIFGVVAEWYSC